eukprot:SM000049S16728  [mRNA]  locus=s49:349597:353882:- [translate_table: standard]
MGTPSAPVAAVPTAALAGQALAAAGSAGEASALLAPLQLAHAGPAFSSRRFRSLHARSFPSRKQRPARRLTEEEAGAFKVVVCETAAEVEEKALRVPQRSRNKDLPHVNGNGAVPSRIDLGHVSGQRISDLYKVNGNATSHHESSGSSIAQFLRGKHVLITGSTGFLAKVLVEKVLREQPDVGQLYLVIQPQEDVSAQQRLERQVIPSQIFDSLRSKRREEYKDFMADKLTAISGSMSHDCLGLIMETSRDMLNKVEIIINSAATTAFDERYDVALNVNTLGARRVAAVAAECPKLELLLHVSTAYVNGKRIGWTLEKPFFMGDCIARELSTSSDVPCLDIEEEIALCKQVLEKAQETGARTCKDEAEAAAYVQEQMVALGLQRSQMHGWQDTYVFTKAMGEMFLSEARDKFPIAIVRPSIIESAILEPVFGWIEGFRMADPILLAYGKGHMDGFLADNRGILDMVPVDMVTNAILAVLWKHAKTKGLSVYHLATSVLNPVTMQQVVDYTSDHFEEHPMVAKNGIPIRPSRRMMLYQKLHVFLFNMWLKHQLPLQLAKFSPWSNKTGLAQKRNNLMSKTFQQLTYLAKIYAPYTFYSCRFDASNTENLYNELSPEDKRRFNFDLRRIDWQEYITRIHLPGLRKYVLKGRGSS